MAIFSLADGCRMLAIDSKTLRRWLERSHLSVQPHPLDARLRCVTLEQLHQVAAVHHRSLSEGHGLHLQPDAPSLSPPTDIMSLSAGANDSRHPSDLSTQLADLQTHITTLQHQLALLTEQVQQEREWRMSAAKLLEDKSLESAQDKSLKSSQDKSLKSSQDKSLKSSQDKSLKSSQHYNRTCLGEACRKALLKKNGSGYQSEVISDCSEAATSSKRAIVRRSVIPRERLWERPWKVR